MRHALCSEEDGAGRMHSGSHLVIRRTRTVTGLLASLSAMLMAGVLACGCNVPRGESFGEIAPGMSQADVRAILGEPSSRRVVAESDRDAIGYAERWQYGDTLSSLATDAMFPDAPDSRVYVVFFDSTGQVIETRRPQPEDSLWQPSWEDQSPFDR